MRHLLVPLLTSFPGTRRGVREHCVGLRPALPCHHCTDLRSLRPLYTPVVTLPSALACIYTRRSSPPARTAATATAIWVLIAHTDYAHNSLGLPGGLRTVPPGILGASGAICAGHTFLGVAALLAGSSRTPRVTQAARRAAAARKACGSSCSRKHGNSPPDTADHVMTKGVSQHR